MKPPIDRESLDQDAPYIAVVTGSSSGIGQAIALELARRGARVLIHARRNVSGLMQTANSIHELQSTIDSDRACRGVVADLSSSQSIFELTRAAFSWYGYINTWVHAAGADVLTGAAGELPFEDKLELLWTTDVRGTLLLSRRVADEMLRAGVPQQNLLPSMVHLGWDQADGGMEGDSGQYFAAIKGAVAAFSKSLAKTYAPHVRVNCVSPGWIQTEWGRGASSAWSQRSRDESLLNRWGDPQDVARLVAAISMGDGEFVNGQTLNVNGGWRGGSSAVRCSDSRDARPTLN